MNVPAQKGFIVNHGENLIKNPDGESRKLAIVNGVNPSFKPWIGTE
jgi:hypothetical protein